MQHMLQNNIIYIGDIGWQTQGYLGSQYILVAVLSSVFYTRAQNAWSPGAQCFFLIVVGPGSGIIL